MRLTSQYITIFFTLFMLIQRWSVGQTTTIEGKVLDSQTNEPIPFANIFLKKTNTGTSSDEKGIYTLEANIKQPDTITISALGYKSASKLVHPGEKQTINFQLYSESLSLEGFIVYADDNKKKENPAFSILKKTLKSKSKNDKRTLIAFEYESYNKTELYISNISENFEKRKVYKKIQNALDSLNPLKDSKGKPMIPLLISENISKMYKNNEPNQQVEHILKTKVTGVGVEDGSFITQFLGASYREINFYKNWLSIIEKDFVSPIADGWKLYYEYELYDSLYVNGSFCYQINFFPKREQDLAFWGKMWITKDEYALKKIEAIIKEEANLNYVDFVEIKQELCPTSKGPWLPYKTSMTISVKALTQNSLGALVKLQSSTKDWIVNQPQKPRFYSIPIIVEEDFSIHEKDFWAENRHDTLSQKEQKVYQMIDKVKNVNMVKTYYELLFIIIDGHKRIGLLDFGQYLTLYAYNKTEGHRFQMGVKTNEDFSKKWSLGGYAAYGTLDRKMKYRAAIQHIISRRKWTTLGVSYQRDIDQVGLNADELEEDNNIFAAFTRWGTLTRPYYNTIAKIDFFSQVIPAFSYRINLQHKQFDPLYPFYYYTTSTENGTNIATSYKTAEANIVLQWLKGAEYLQRGNTRRRVALGKWPAFTLTYTLGLKDIFASNFEYQKIAFNINQRLNLGVLGRFTYELDGGYIFSRLPYPLLKTHIGNQSPFYTSAAYNLMNFFEFVSDQYASLYVLHKFNGYILNRVPLVKKLKWRLLAHSRVLYGDVRTENKTIIPEKDPQNQPIPSFGFLNPAIPYVEVGYGIENIFKVFRVDFFHRLTYLDQPNVRKFGVKFSAQIIF